MKKIWILGVILIVFIVGAIIQTNMDEKVYYPEETVDNPFPGEDAVLASGATTSPGTYTPTTTKTKPFPKKKVALELLSTALNTKTKKILQEFEFTPSGALQIGTFEAGISGDLRLSPNGILARDTAGLTTFAIDGTTGDAVFRGEVRAADFVVSDERGLISLNNFDSGYVDNDTVHTITPGGSYVEVDVTAGGSALVVEFDLARESNVFIFFNASGRCTVAGGFQLVAIYRDNGNGAPFTQLTGHSRISGAINDAAGSMGVTTASQGKIVTLDAGHHRLALRHRSAGANSCIIQDMTIGYMVLGR